MSRGFSALAACGSSAPSSAQDSSGRANLPATKPPFAIAEVATFNSPWAMDFLPGLDARACDREGRTPLAGRCQQRCEEGNRRRTEGRLRRPGRPARREGGPAFRAGRPRLSDLLGALAGRRKPARARTGQAVIEDDRGAALSGLQVIWRNPTGGQGGHFGARIAFAPDGNSLFLSAGERQRFTPAQDPSLPMGKILHLTLDGKPLGQRELTSSSAPPRSRSPTRPRTAKRRSAPRGASSPGRGRTARRPRPGRSATATRSASPSRPTGGCGRSRWARGAATSST